MSTQPLVKDPDSVLDFTFDYSAWLDDDTISSSTFTISPDTLTEDSSSNTTTTTTIFLSAGTAFTYYEVHNRVVTAGGRTDDRSFFVFVQPSSSDTGVPAAQNLLDVRRLLVERSGRWDLVLDAEVGNYTDNGANQLINEAQRLLDRMLNYSKESAWLYKALAVGQTRVIFEQARYIQEVWINQTGAGRTELEKIDMNKMRLDYVNPLVSGEDTGLPRFWTPYITDISPENPSMNIEGVTLASVTVVSINIESHRYSTGNTVFFRDVLGATELNGNTYTVTKTDDDNFTLDSTDGDDFTAWTSAGSATKLDSGLTDTDVLALGDTFPQRSILIMPPSDGVRTVEVLCGWYSPKLTHDSHRSYWTVEYPELLVRAAQRNLEVDWHRNSTGRRDFEEALKVDLRDVYHQLINEQASGHHSLFQMKG